MIIVIKSIHFHSSSVLLSTTRLHILVLKLWKQPCPYKVAPGFLTKEHNPSAALLIGASPHLTWLQTCCSFLHGEVATSPGT